MKEQVLPLIKEVPGSMGFYMRHIEREEELAIEADKVFPLGAVFQIGVMVEVFRQSDKQKLSLDETIELQDSMKSVGPGIVHYLSTGLEFSLKDLIVLMMTISDNSATDLLWKKVGIQSVNMMLRELGFNRTDISIPNREYYLLSLLQGEEFEGLSMTEFIRIWKNKSHLEIMRSLSALQTQTNDLPIEEFRARVEAMYGRRGKKRFNQKRTFDEAVDNQGSPREMGMLLSKVFEGQLSSPSACQRMLGIMLLRQDQSSIASFLPPEIAVAGKGGSLAGTKNAVGVAYINPKSHFVVSCLTKKLNQGDGAAAGEIIGKITKLVYDHYNRVTL